MDEGEVTALTETSYSQSLNMKNLYAELEEERNASATAAVEALSMILRLQEEKAAAKLEACQYKRLAEEKMNHAEESIAILEEAMFYKEMEIASLKYQVQAYKHKLLRIDVSNLDVGEMQIFDYLFSNSSFFLDKRNFPGFIRRNLSLPAARFDQLCLEMDTAGEEGFILPRRQPTQQKIDECMVHPCGNYEEITRRNLSEEYVTEEYDYDREQDEEADITEPNENSKGEPISANNELEKSVVEYPVNLRKCGSCSWYSSVNIDELYDSTVQGRGVKFDDETFKYLHSQTDQGNMLDCDPHASSCLKSDLNGDIKHSIRVQETEVLGSQGCCILNQSLKHVLQEPILEAKSIIGTPRSNPQEAADRFLRAGDYLAFMSTEAGKTISTSREDASVDDNLITVKPSIANASSHPEVEQLKQCMQKLENEMKTMKQEFSKGGEEQLKLLRNINDQLNTIQLDIRSSEIRKTIPQDDSSLLPLVEAMLSFWI